MKELIVAILDENAKIFVVYITALKVLKMLIHLAWETQIFLLHTNKDLSKIYSKYSNYSDVFSPNLIIELPNLMDMKHCAIKLKSDKQSPYEMYFQP